MEQLEYIESLVNEMYTQDSPDSQIPTAVSQLLEWQDNCSVFNIIDISIEFLSTRTNQRILFFAATSLRICVQTKWNEFNDELVEKLVSFLCEYIINKQPYKNTRSYAFILICFADIVVLTEDFPIQQIFSNFPIDIQIEICSYYFEEKSTKFYAPLINQSYFPVPDEIIEYVHNILQETELSPQWIRLYHNFAMGLEYFQPLVVYMPKLFEAAKIIPLSKTLIDHIKEVLIKDVLVKDLGEPDEYHFEIAYLSIELSSNLRAAIQNNPNDFNLPTQLILLWDSVLYLEDAEEYFLKPEYISITINLINEFIEAEKTLIDSVEITQDIDLWPSLMVTAMRFCDNFTEECPIANFAINVLEFILTGLDLGVQLIDIQEKLSLFYRGSEALFNEYFVDPSLKSPSLLLIIGYLNSYIPYEIAELYCNNFQEFDAPPLVQIYFANQFVDKFEEYAASFVNIYFQFFDDFPYECSNGFYLVILNYPQLIDESIIEHFTEWIDIMPFNKLGFLIPTMVLIVVRITGDIVEQTYANIIQVITNFFMDAMQVPNKQNLILFFYNLHLIIVNMLNSQESFDSEPDDEGYKLFLSFGQQIFNFISDSLQGIWMEPDKKVQYMLTQFICDFFQLNFISNPSAIASWLNDIFANMPFNFHLSLIYFLRNDIQLMPNVLEFIKMLDLSKPEFINTILNLTQNLIPEWDDDYWNIIPPEIIFGEVLDSDKNRQSLAISIMSGLTRNPKISPEFKVQILQVLMEGIETVYFPPATDFQAKLILCLSESLGIETVISTFSEHIPISEEEQQLLGGLISSFLFPQENPINEEEEEEEGNDENVNGLEKIYKKILKHVTEFLSEILKRKFQ